MPLSITGTFSEKAKDCVRKESYVNIHCDLPQISVKRSKKLGHKYLDPSKSAHNK